MGVIGCTLSVGRKVKLEIPAQVNPFISPDPIPASRTREMYWSTDVSAPKPPHRSWVLPFASAVQMGETSPQSCFLGPAKDIRAVPATAQKEQP